MFNVHCHCWRPWIRKVDALFSQRPFGMSIKIMIIDVEAHNVRTQRTPRLHDQHRHRRRMPEDRNDSHPLPRRPAMSRPAFTLVELLVVITIILAVSVLAIATVVPSLGERSVIAGTQALQGAVVEAQGRATATNAPAGFRLEPDPAFPFVPGSPPNTSLASSRLISLSIPPDYTEGLVRVDTGPFPLPLPSPVLVVEQSSNISPTNWFWNVRVGDQISIGSSSHRYTVVGPMVSPSAESFANVGPQGTVSPLDRGKGPVEFLWLVNGVDDNNDGFVDNGYDGVTDNSETEHWFGSIVSGIEEASYAIHRRPAPDVSGAITRLPAGCVIDLTGWDGDKQRSRLQVNPLSGSVDVLFSPQGRPLPTSIYSSPSSIGMDQTALWFWVADRGDIGLPPHGYARLLAVSRAGRISILDPADSQLPHLDALK